MFWRHKEPDFDANFDIGKGDNVKANPVLDHDDSGLPPLDQHTEAYPGRSHEIPGMPGSNMSETPMHQSFEPEPSFHPSQMQMQQQQPMQSYPINKDIELISAKLDAIKSNLDSINQRLANLERIAREGI